MLAVRRIARECWPRGLFQPAGWRSADEQDVVKAVVCFSLLSSWVFGALA